MAIKTYSKKNDGETKLSKSFKVKEFACKDGSDEIKISDELVKLLQHIRNELGQSLTINSGYRTPSYNKRIGGATNSKHTLGMASDLRSNGIDPLVIAWIADIYLGGKGGIELCSYSTGTDGFVHVDVRDNKWRAALSARNKNYTSYPTLFSTLRYGSSGHIVTILSRKLIKLGYLSAVQSTFADVMNNAVRKFQQDNDLVVDGIFGTKSWCKLIELLRK